MIFLYFKKALGNFKEALRRFEGSFVKEWDEFFNTMDWLLCNKSLIEEYKIE
jgi:hypothetical protein